MPPIEVVGAAVARRDSPRAHPVFISYSPTPSLDSDTDIGVGFSEHDAAFEPLGPAVEGEDIADVADMMIARDRLPLTIRRRLRRLADQDHPTRRVYTLSTLSNDIGWDGQVRPVVLSVESGAICLRVVGILQGFQYHADRGAPPDLSIDIDPLRDVDRRGMLRIIRSAVPPPDDIDEEDFYLHAELITRDPNYVFSEVYDATRRMRPTPYLARIPLTNILPGDYVMVECKVRRDPVGRHGWDVRFDLMTAYLLHRARD
ncbi:uncharacterized protein TRAVEDRAFT_21908 [Trametes versicolor FP-101664 SS1]|uniref:uncharacterized protein n=1 Tax=Trametes versicolor (strain FP-101664) TaxID=717944 RepID=UPI00046221FE|nr:uncharacterized protein TRAVEDRAFT_21908 [Trametes versicolor FP-101664 SS1]EIW56986.1 hypothetical protein TRAVEDRAFT_21908 [Trametes versicolor FP-101664 SS1]